MKVLSVLGSTLSIFLSTPAVAQATPGVSSVISWNRNLHCHIWRLAGALHDE
jgi:hypothetical protein